MDAKIKNLLVDFGGVLVGLNRARCIENFRKLGIGDIDSLIGLYFQDDLFGKHEKGLISDHDFCKGVSAFAGRQISESDIIAAWNSFLEDIPLYKLKFLRDARQQRKVFLLSNTNHIHWQYALKHLFDKDGLHVEECFDRVFLSYEMKMVKPDAEIFRTVLAEAGIKADETLFVDDSEVNCNAAAALGINTFCAAPGDDWTVKI